MEVSEYFNLPDFNTDLVDTAKVKNFAGLMKHEYDIILAKHTSPLSRTKNFLDLLKAIIPLLIT